MSSNTYDAKERFLESFGIGIDAAKLAIKTEPAARAIFDHAVAFIEKYSPSHKVVDRATGFRIFNAGFEAGATGIDLARRSARPKSMHEAVSEAWEEFLHTPSSGVAEPAPPKNEATRIVENRIAASTGVSPSAQERTPPTSKPSDLFPGKEPSVETLESYFQGGVTARNNRSANPFPPGTISCFMHMKGWVFRDIQILAIVSDQTYGNQMRAAGYITEEQLLDEQRRWKHRRANRMPPANKE